MITQHRCFLLLAALGWLVSASWAKAQLAPGEVKVRPETGEYRPFDFVLSTDQGIEFYQERIKRDPQDCSGYTLLGQMFIRKARETGNFALYDKAETAIRHALELDPDYLAAQLNQALILCARHKFKEGLNLAEQLARKNPSEPQILIIVADAHLELGHYAAAENTYRQLKRRDRLAYLATREARLAELNGHPDEALRLMQAAADRESQARISREGGAWYQVRLGDLHFGLGHLDASAQHYQEALKVLPRSAPALAGLAQVRTGQGKYPEAIELYQRALRVNPDCYMLAALGDLYVKTGKPALAQILFDKLDQTAAQGEGAYNRELALFYANHEQKLDQAVELARKDLTVRQDIYAYDTLAWALCKNNQPQEAQQTMAKALKLGTQDANLFYHAGMIQLRLGHREQARDYLQKALGLNPHFALVAADDARRTLAALGGQ
jgi:tetratricopeptide (TPR) repeat protein